MMKRHWRSWKIKNAKGKEPIPQITSSAWTPRKGYTTIGKTANQKDNENARYRVRLIKKMPNITSH